MESCFSSYCEKLLNNRLTDNWICKFSGICRYFRNSSGSLPILQLPISAIPLGTWVPKIGESNRRPLAMLRPNASLSAALNLLIQGVLFFITITVRFFSFFFWDWTEVQYSFLIFWHRIMFILWLKVKTFYLK